MNDKNTTMSVSLPNRKIYSVCYLPYDTAAEFHGTLYEARRRFLEKRKAVKIRETGIYGGLSGKAEGKITRHKLKWKKTAGGYTVETYFTQYKQRGIAFYDPGDILRCRVYFDRDQQWVRSEYFRPEDPHRAKISFKPNPVRDAILRFNYNSTTGTTKETVLLPVPYAFQTAEQSLQNAQFGEDLFIVSTDTGEFAYCPKAEQQKRLEFLEENRGASVMLSMGWEIRDGDVASPDAALPENTAPALPEGEDDDDLLAFLFEDDAPEAVSAEPLSFEEIFAGDAPVEEAPAEEATAEETPAEEAPVEEAPAEEAIAEEAIAEETPVEEAPAEEVPAEEVPAEDAPVEEAPVEEAPVEEAPVENTPAEETPAEEAPTLSDEILGQMRDVLDRILDASPLAAAATAPENAPAALIRSGEAYTYSGQMENGSREGFGRTMSTDGITLYEGEYKNDKREGFGAHHYRSGAMSYIGDFKDDKRDGFGVSFRESDHAMHISRWVDGKPEGHAVLFDPNGALRFAGKIIDGKKQGAGVSIDAENDTVFIAKYENNEPTGEGAMFSGDGTLLYVGGWLNGKRHGRGTEFDRNGDIIYSGEWKDGKYENGILYKKVTGSDENGSN